MQSWIPAWPYRPQATGFWSPQTATINWCEEDYYLTPYAAEVVNTWTNLMFMYLAYVGISNCLRQGHPKIFPVCYLGYLLVGVGSFFFHATLKYPWQLVDELSMIYTTCIMFYATFTYGKTFRYSFAMGVFLVSLAAFITAYYHYLQNPAFHQNAYALLTIAVLSRGMYIMEANIRPRWKAMAREAEALKKDQDVLNGHVSPNGKPFTENGRIRAKSLSSSQKADLIREDERDIKILKTMWSLMAYGLGTFLGGFLIWNLDNIFCGTLRSWRREVGLPWGILLEGHGWWHLLTGIGAYNYIVWGTWLQHCLDKEQDKYDLYWPSTVFSFPVVMRRDRMKGLKGVVFADSKTLKLA